MIEVVIWFANLLGAAQREVVLTATGVLLAATILATISLAVWLVFVACRVLRRKFLGPRL